MATTWEEILEEKRKKVKKEDAKPTKQELQVGDKKRRVSKAPTLATIDKHLLWHTYKDPFMNFIANIMVKPEGKTGQTNTEKKTKEDESEIDFEIWVGQGENGGKEEEEENSS